MKVLCFTVLAMAATPAIAAAQSSTSAPSAGTSWTEDSARPRVRTPDPDLPPPVIEREDVIADAYRADAFDARPAAAVEEDMRPYQASAYDSDVAAYYANLPRAYPEDMGPPGPPPPGYVWRRKIETVTTTTYYD